jgi:hypothetical protein
VTARGKATSSSVSFIGDKAGLHLPYSFVFILNCVGIWAGKKKKIFFVTAQHLVHWLGSQRNTTSGWNR